MKESALSLKEKTTQYWFLSCPRVLKIFYGWPLKYYVFCIWL